MRGIKTSLISILAIAMLAGSAVGVAAQADEADIASVVEVTGTSSMPDGCTMSLVAGGAETPSQERRRFTCHGSIPGSMWSMSDPRLEGTVLRISESNGVTGSALDAFEATCAQDVECDALLIDTQIRAISIENADGAWRERPRFVVSFPGSTFELPFPEMWMTVLDGEGAYEGLVAVLQVTHSPESGQTYHGYIIDADLLPPTPETASAE